MPPETGQAFDGLLGPKSNVMQQLRRLSGRRRARREAHAFVIDGPTLLAEAVEAGLTVTDVFVEPDAPEGSVTAARVAGATVHRIRAGALAATTNPVTPQGVAAIASLPSLDRALPSRGLVVVLVGVADPGNAGTLLRVAEAAGVAAVVCADDAVDVWSPKAVRASAGAVFRVPVHEVGSALDAIGDLRAAGMTVLATVLDGTPLDESDLSGDVALLLGNEARGLDARLVEAASGTITVPMVGRVESLNVAMAGTVLAFDAARQRRKTGATS